MNWEPILGILIGLLVVWVALIVILWILRPRDVPLAELARVVPDLARLVRGLLADRATPWSVRLALAGLLVWIISPIDLIPEFIPVLGPLDDVVVAVIVLRYVRRRLGADEIRNRWPGTPTGFALLVRVMGE